MNKKLTYSQQLRLKILMRNSNVNQTKIAEINNMSSSKPISDMCLGKTSVTPLYKQRFLKAGINLDIILNSDEEIIPTRISYYNKFKEPRVLTYREQDALYKLMRKKKITSLQIAGRLGYRSDNPICRIRNGLKEVNDIIIQAFLDEGINLNTL